MIWCNTHQRPAEWCKVCGGITLPCRKVDLTDILELDKEFLNDLYEKNKKLSDIFTLHFMRF